MNGRPAEGGRFVDPREFGLDYPMHTNEQLCKIARIANGTQEVLTEQQLKKKIEQLSKQLNQLKK